MEKEICRIKIDFDKLEEWRNPEKDGTPICSVLNLYEAIGLIKIIEEYKKDHPDYQMCAIEDLKCNFYTTRHIKSFIESIWSTYDLDIKEDNKVIWNTRKYPKGTKHYEKSLSKKIHKCVLLDFGNYCPGLDEELEDDVLVFRVFEDDG